MSWLCRYGDVLARFMQGFTFGPAYSTICKGTDVGSRYGGDTRFSRNGCRTARMKIHRRLGESGPRPDVELGANKTDDFDGES